MRYTEGMSRSGFMVLFLLAGCGSSAGDTDVALPPDNGLPPGNTCMYASDGLCDEPVNCVVGTDSLDCEAACAAGETPHLLAGACAFRDPPDHTVETGPGTGGELHLTGYRDGTILTPTGENASEDVPRHYRLFVPSSYRPDQPAPVVIMLPGHRVDHYSLAQYTQLDRSAERNGFIAVYAEQQWRWQSGRWAWWTDWNWTSATVENPDLVYLRRLVERIGNEYNVDRSRVFSVGHSRGGAMAIIAGLEMPDVFAGICTQSGFTEFQYHEVIAAYSGRKVPMVFVHGALDPDVCIDCEVNQMGCMHGPAKPCSAMGSDALVEQLGAAGWTDHDLFYYRLDNVAHRWQPQLNQPVWDYLNARPHPEHKP